MNRIISLVQCVSKKKDSPSCAKNLYTSSLFVNASAYAEKISDKWFILSAKYGLVEPREWIEPYDVTLKNMSASERRIWADLVFSELKPILNRNDKVVILAGVIYRMDLIKKIKDFGCEIEIPLKGLRIGEQVSWLKKNLQDDDG
jgi:hypothetical protein